MKSSSLSKSLFLLSAIVALVMGVMYLFQYRGWRKIRTANAPPAVVLSSVAYDKKSDYALFFGGVSSVYVDPEWKSIWWSETWKWDGSTWEKIQTKNTPPPREKHAMAYDENRDVIIMFGGASGDTRLNDTWEWSGEDWVEMKPQHVPPARCCHAMAYDPVRKGVILYAGWDGADVFWDDTWLWDGADWTQLPYWAPQMSGHAMVQYPPDNAVISMQTNAMNTWALTADGWSDLAIQGPPDRSDGRADYGEGKIIYFGGSRDSTRMNDTWMFTAGSWYKLDLPYSPSARFGHVLFYDEKRGSFIMFGGANTQYLNDTWELKFPANISSITTLPSVP